MGRWSDIMQSSPIYCNKLCSRKPAQNALCKRNEVNAMICAIVPARNEAGRAATVLKNLARLELDHIIFIANGCRDTTVCEAAKLPISTLQFLYFHESLGIDVPRAIGAKMALNLGADVALFVDGDMIGSMESNLRELIRAIPEKRLDLALTNCYPSPPRHIERCNPTFRWRMNLNKELNLEDKIHIASPAHGPHAVSKRFLQTIALHELAIPPAALALAQKHRLNIGLGTTIPHYLLGSSVKGQHHSTKIIDTIVGDCLEGIAIHRGTPRLRVWQNKTYVGYHSERRFDLLDEFLTML